MDILSSLRFKENRIWVVILVLNFCFIKLANYANPLHVHQEALASSSPLLLRVWAIFDAWLLDFIVIGNWSSNLTFFNSFTGDQPRKIFWFYPIHEAFDALKQTSHPSVKTSLTLAVEQFILYFWFASEWNLRESAIYVQVVFFELKSHSVRQDTK